MAEIRRICKADIPSLLEDKTFWNHGFLAVSRHRLYAHLKNPNALDSDVVLLLAYVNGELLGYMGAFIDIITVNGRNEKIAWLSTWWVDPKTKGTGIGREILDTMYQIHNGRIGISQFTPSAKRVYDKSGYFVRLKLNTGIKAVLRSNLSFVIPAVYPKLAVPKSVLQAADNFLNWFINIKIWFHKKSVASKLNNCTIEYLAFPDAECEALIEAFSKSPISRKTVAFFEWLKAYNWVMEAPLIRFVKKEKYTFSMVDEKFDIYLMKVLENGIPKGFVVLQRRGFVCKVLFNYSSQADSDLISKVIALQCMEQNVREIITYDEGLVNEFKKSGIFLYRTKKLKESIISKSFGVTSFDDQYVNFGDGDCSFA